MIQVDPVRSVFSCDYKFTSVRLPLSFSFLQPDSATVIALNFRYSANREMTSQLPSLTENITKFFLDRTFRFFFRLKKKCQRFVGILNRLKSVENYPNPLSDSFCRINGIRRLCAIRNTKGTVRTRVIERDANEKERERMR